MKSLFTSALLFTAFLGFAQMQIDKQIQLTGTGNDARITGIKQVITDEDATNKKYVDSLVAANSGSTIDLDFNFTASPTTVSAGASGGSTPTITLTATATSGIVTPISVSVSGLPFGVSYSLTPTGGYPVPSLSMSLVLTTTSAAPGTYTVTVTATGGITPKTQTITLSILSKRVFITSTRYSNGNLGGLSGADSKCQTHANNAGLGGTWAAFLSTSTVDAKDRIPDATYVRVDGQPVASDKADLLDGNIQNPINITESGGTNTWLVHTGTNPNGTKIVNKHCSDWTSTSSSVQEGWSGRTDSWWTTECCGGLSCSGNQMAIYCFEL